MSTLKGRLNRQIAKACLPTARSTISAAVLLALYGLPPAARADATPNDAARNNEPATLEEIIVTASRREQTTEEIPYAISVVGPAEIAANSVTDLATLTRQIGVAGGSSAQSSAYTFPIIRGLNASPASTGFRTIEQAPVSTYIGNSPIDGYFQLEDIQRVEVLRGPQGTLYGAGSLGGALRVIPNAPQLDKFAGDIDGRAGDLDHGGHAAYTLTGMVNIPIGETLAFRGAANYEYVPGFIDAHGIFERGPSGFPVLADPSDPVNSSGVLTSKSDWNDQKTFTGRASLLWKPTSEFSATLAYTRSHAIGDADTSVNPLFQGGPDPIDPRLTLPPGGRYTDFSVDDLPFSRKTDLTSLDVSYDAGFATLSSTSSYFTTGGYFAASPELALLRPQFLPYVPYYAGNPINPRWVAPDEFADTSHAFTQEVRLVSNTGPDKLFDYVVGLFFERQSRYGELSLTVPGSPERSVAQGCTAPVYYGSTFPNCLVQVGPNDLANLSQDSQNFEDRSVFGELTWHFAKNWQITGGFRYFKQSFTDTSTNALYDFATVQAASVNSAPVSKVVGKADISWEYTRGQHVYALWSQGFRRGGANGYLLSGAFKDEAPNTYAPDTVNNYETGFKGRFGSGISYTFDGFYVDWNNPQVGGLTPDSNIGVWNAKKAVSKGVEWELSTPLAPPGLRLMLGGTYADAKLTQDYSYPDFFGNIVGKSGEQLPGSPKLSTAATLSYGRDLVAGYNLLLSLNDTYTTRVVTTTFAVLGQEPTAVPALNELNAAITVSHDSWRVGIYGTNLQNRYVVLSRTAMDPAVAYSQSLAQPREIYLRGGYAF